MPLLLGLTLLFFGKKLRFHGGNINWLYGQCLPQNVNFYLLFVMGLSYFLGITAPAPRLRFFASTTTFPKSVNITEITEMSTHSNYIWCCKLKAKLCFNHDTYVCTRTMLFRRIRSLFKLSFIISILSNFFFANLFEFELLYIFLY